MCALRGEYVFMLGVRVEDPLQTLSHLLTACSAYVHTLEISMSNVLS